MRAARAAAAIAAAEVVDGDGAIGTNAGAAKLLVKAADGAGAAGLDKQPPSARSARAAAAIAAAEATDRAGAAGTDADVASVAVEATDVAEAAGRDGRSLPRAASSSTTVGRNMGADEKQHSHHEVDLGMRRTRAARRRDEVELDCDGEVTRLGDALMQGLVGEDDFQAGRSFG